MFANFLYLLVALILYTTCQYPLTSEALPDNAVLSALLLVIIFAGICRLTFKRLEARAAEHYRFNLDHQLEKSLSRLSILALFVFAADLYFLRLKLLFSGIGVFKVFPTFGALLFLGLFVFYLVIIWIFAWKFQKRFLPGTVSKKSFVLSNISFSLPALLPWCILSLTADIIQVLPFEGPKRFLSTPQGEICYVVVFLFAVASFGPLLIQKLWGCTSLEHGLTRERIESLCKRAGLNYADILKWELFGGSMITAGVMGLVGKFRYILVTPAMINLLHSDEIDAVIAHEIGHVQKKHIHFYLFFFAGYIACVYAFFEPFLLLTYFLMPLVEALSFTGMEPETAIALFFSLILILLFLLYFRYVFGFFMRNFERQADIHVYSLMDDATSLIATFFKISRFSRQPAEKPNWHHFSISQRINFLNQCEMDRSLINRHNSKIRKMIFGYVLVILLVCSAGYWLHAGPGKEMLNRFFTEKILIPQLQVDSENADVYTLIGDYYYETEQFEKAVSAYANVLKIDPDNLHALNNLAWLYATCSNVSFRDYEKALRLSEKAIQVERAPFVLDTYAEACFANKLYDGAREASLEALGKAEDRLDYYKSQVERFQARGQ